MNNFTLSHTPHIHGSNNISKIMRDVIIALTPAMIGGIYFFGLKVLATLALSVAFCVGFEYLWNTIIKKENTINDLSAVVTGIILALSLPPSTPLWMVMIGDAFAIIVVKCFYGGIGQNFVNPALAARAFLLACWPIALTTFSKPCDPLELFQANINATTGATPLTVIKISGKEPELFNLFFGYVSGSIGEVSALLLLIGGIYLLARKVINIIIPVTYIVSVGIFGVIFTQYSFLFHILSGAVVMAGFFMATDYTTSPVTKLGQFIYAFIAGLITSVIRKFGGYPEGVTYAILIMNIVTPLLDKYIKPKKFGKAVKSNG